MVQNSILGSSEQARTKANANALSRSCLNQLSAHAGPLVPRNLMTVHSS